MEDFKNRIEKCINEKEEKRKLKKQRKNRVHRIRKKNKARREQQLFENFFPHLSLFGSLQKKMQK